MEHEIMSSNHAAWVVITNSNTCRIYQYSKNPNQLTLVKEIKHPENKLRDIDLTSDKPGHYKSSNATHGAYSQPSDPKEIKIDAFSREIAKELEHARTTNAYKDLIIIASTHMNGLLLNHMNKNVKNLVSHNLEKDVFHLPQHELLEFLKIHTQYPGES
jgi:protein required for attachment to host cells